MQHLGRQLRRLRELAGVSQGQLARLAGVSQPAVSRLEAARGLATPLLVVVKIGLALAGELRKLDPSILDPELRRALESPEPFGPLLGVLRPDAMPVTADPDLEALVRLYRRTPERQRQGVLAIMAAAIDGL
jgi:transcriptional regulator with XRE-family HTH domain